MVKFSCFFSPIIHHNRSKKFVNQSAGAMHSIAKVNSQDREIKVSLCSEKSNTSEQVTSTSSPEGCWKSDDLTGGNSCPDESKDGLKMMSLKKSQSLGSVLDKRRGFSVTEDDEMDQEFSFDNYHENDVKIDDDSFARIGQAEGGHENEAPESFESIADHEHHESIFSIEALKQLSGDQHADAAHSTSHTADSVHSSANTAPVFGKSRSETNLRGDADSSGDGRMTRELSGLRSRSFEDLSSLHGGSEATFQRHKAGSYSHDTPELSDIDGHAEIKEEYALSNTSVGSKEVANHETADKYLDENIKSENQSVDEYKSHNVDYLASEWREPETDDAEISENFQEVSIHNWDQLTSEEFNFKRIEDWISQIDIQDGIMIEELGESSSSVPKKDSQVAASVATTKHNPNDHGMEVAYNYISSLPASSSAAHMSNLGLVAVPFLGAFSSLRVLNLSSNAIGRINAGVLPRGLHMLNLSRNNISTIEGLRDLTRLRVLDLSFNRIIKIGHGLASCSSLRELYLAGNMISAVEGLHRLLKLNLLDLRFNKISTAKGLGQLAANYGSLQAIYLEGNPALINLGGEQLKKYLLSLLPKLLYFNKQTIRLGSSKDVSDRPMRALSSSHQSDRGSRRGSHSSGPHRSTSSSNVRANSVVSSSLKQSKNRHVRLPPGGAKATNLGSKPLILRPSNPIHRSLSEGTL